MIAIAGLLNVLLVPLLLVATFLRARYDYIRLASVPRVDIRDLQARGLLAKATFCGWVRDGLTICCRSRRCSCCPRAVREQHDRLMRLSGVYRAGAPSYGGGPSSMQQMPVAATV
eukprot:SAG31_NODE_1201_length_9418_cov_3.410881_9_plen_115_part_00